MPTNPQSPIRLYYWPTPNGFKPAIMLEECGLPYRTRYVDIGAGDQFKPSFLKISPNNRMPAIVDPDGPGCQPVTVFESGAILLYLGRKTGKFYPTNPRARIAVEEWLMWQMGGVGPMAGQAHHFIQYAPRRIPYACNRYINEVARLYGVLDRRLEGRDFVCGRYSIADMALWPWVRLWSRQEQDIRSFPNVAAWIERVGERPAVKRAVALGKSRRRNLAKDDSDRKTLFGAAAVGKTKRR